MQVLVETGEYMWFFLRKGTHISGNMKYQGHTIDQELLGSVGTIYSFLYFSVGHFPRYESPCKI
jgi:hypothetical protein